ncbi:Eco57I restriction-modification methylase domain-containing protein [Pseudoclavibacter soli]|uniref:Eco57I restriction-modification methylase domain-containing protein n=1 Tax=Pseudoclavibacter soli TaxID=452623 RepID=UPI0004095151|nr:hypothetical protein [Pseudoclavibacter soli]
MKDEYPDSKSDLFAGFIERCTNLAGPQGTVAMITMQSWMFLSSYEKLRASLLSKQRITTMLHLGARAFDSIGGEVVSSTAFTLVNVSPEARSTARKRAGAFIRLVDGASEAEKKNALSTALEVRAKEAGFHVASDVDFTAIPGSPIVYWLSEKMRAAFRVGKPLGEIVELLVGLRTGDNGRFIRQWWEVSQDRTMFNCESLQCAETSGRRWFPYNKGGAFRRWYGNHEHVINWEQDGREIEEGLAERYPYMVPQGKTLVRGQGRGRYFSPSVSWSDISSGEAAFRRYPHGFIHDSTGHSGFGDQTTLDQITLLLNSKFVMEVMKVVAPTLHFHVGYVGLVPVAAGVRELPTVTIDMLVATAREDWNATETSWNFVQNPLVPLMLMASGDLD